MSSAVGLYGLVETNEAGEQLEDFCLEHELKAAVYLDLSWWQHPESDELHLNCAKVENKLDELSDISGSRLRHRSSVACGDAESQVG